MKAFYQCKPLHASFFLILHSLITIQSSSLVSCFSSVVKHTGVKTSITRSRKEAIESAASTVTSILMSSSPANANADGQNIMSVDEIEKTKDFMRWGIVGLGDVCTKKSGPPFYKCDGSSLVAVMRRTPGKAKQFASQVPPTIVNGKQSEQCKGYESLDEFLLHPNLDAVYVSTRPGTHLEICQKVAEAGIGACYVEKPVGRCAEEAKAIEDMFAQKGLKLYTAYISRAYEKTQAVKRLLEEGAVGERLNSISYKIVGDGGARGMDTVDLPWRLDASQSGGGLVMDVGCHVLDRLDYLCGPLVNVKGTAENRNSPGMQVEDYVNLTARIGKGDWGVIPSEGATVECTWNFAPTDKDAQCDELQFIGAEGSLRMAGSPSDPITVHDAQGKFVRQLTFDVPEHTAQGLIQAVTDDLRGMAKKDYLSFGNNAVRTQKVLDQVLGSYYDGRESGYWTRTDTWPGSPGFKGKGQY